MKIVYITGPSLSDTDMPLIAALRERGHRVVCVLTMTERQRQGTIVSPTVLKPVGGLFPATDYPSLATLERYLPLSDIYVCNMPKARDLAPSSLRAQWQLCRFIRKEQFDVVHVTMPLRYGSFMLYAFRKKMVLTMHDPLPHSSDQRRITRFHRRVAFSLLRHFIILSDSLREEFISQCRLTSKNVSVTGMSAYYVYRDVKPAVMQLPKRYVLFIGSIQPHKGVKYLCEAMTMLRETQPDLHLVVAGKGMFDFDVHSYESTIPLTVINRYITTEELVALVSGSLLVVCPYTDATQSGVVMTSFALDKPVLATRTGAIPEQLDDMRHGRLVPPRDSAALATAIDSMLQPGELQRMARNITADFSQGQRSWAEIATKTERVYQMLTDNKKKR